MSCIKGALDDQFDNQTLFNHMALLNIFLTLLSCFVRSKSKPAWTCCLKVYLRAGLPCIGIPSLVFCQQHVVILYAGEAVNVAIWTE